MMVIDEYNLDSYSRLTTFFINVKDNPHLFNDIEIIDKLDNVYIQMAKGGLLCFDPRIIPSKDKNTKIKILLLDLKNIHDFNIFSTQWVPRVKALSEKYQTKLTFKLTNINILKFENVLSLRWACGFIMAMTYL